MTDRELLELAAKAAGWSCWQSKHGYLNVTDPHDNKHVCCRDWVPFDAYSGEKTNEPTLSDAVAELGWNPLIDDGDALRLAVQLGLFIDIYDTEVMAGWVVDEDSSSMETLNQPKGNDPYAATRRAIVEAAAAIGKNMEVTK
jgi:hypothetical protein